MTYSSIRKTAFENPLRFANEEIEHFALEGYVVKRGVLDPDLMRSAVDLMWGTMPPRLDRHDPSTWKGEISDCTGTHSISARYGKVKLRHDIWGNDVLDDLITRNGDIFGMVEQLLGPGNVLPPERFRGLYPIFPTPEHKGVPAHAHVDSTKTPFKVSIAAYLSDVPEHGGAFTVWPGSHRTLFYDFVANSSGQENQESESFRKHFRSIDRTEPLELPGQAGDVIFFHYALMHSAGINSIPGHVRQAAFCNYRRTSWEEDMSKPRPQTIWEGWDGILALNSEKIRQSILPPAIPVGGERSGGGLYTNFQLARARRKMLRIMDKLDLGSIRRRLMKGAG